MKDLGLWDAEDGVHQIVQDQYGKVVSHLHIYPDRGVYIRFTDGTTLKCTLVPPTDQYDMAIKINIGHMDDLPARFLHATNHGSLDEMIGLTFTALEKNVLEFGELAIGIEPDQTVLMRRSPFTIQ